MRISSLSLGKAVSQLTKQKIILNASILHARSKYWLSAITKDDRALGPTTQVLLYIVINHPQIYCILFSTSGYILRFLLGAFNEKEGVDPTPLFYFSVMEFFLQGRIFQRLFFLRGLRYPPPKSLQTYFNL